MTLKWLIVDRVLTARQTFTSPSIYLDHWAVRHFSDHTGDAERFNASLARLNGTLLFSYLNLAEFVPPSRPENAIAAERFLNSICAQLFFSGFDYRQVTEPSVGMLHIPVPPSDREVLNLIAKNPKSTIQGFSFTDIVTEIAASEDLSQSFRRSQEGIAKHMLGLRRDEKFRRRVLNHQPRPDAQKTIVMLEELMRPYLEDEQMNFPNNHATDLQHALIPSACCDYVLLDSTWAARVNEARQRLKMWRYPSMPAEVFSSKPGEVERFLRTLESR